MRINGSRAKEAEYTMRTRIKKEMHGDCVWKEVNAMFLFVEKAV